MIPPESCGTSPKDRNKPPVLTDTPFGDRRALPDADGARVRHLPPLLTSPAWIDPRTDVGAVDMGGR